MTTPAPVPPSRGCQWWGKTDHMAPGAKPCGKPSLPGYSYCKTHKPRVWRPIFAGR